MNKILALCVVVLLGCAEGTPEPRELSIYERNVLAEQDHQREMRKWARQHQMELLERQEQRLLKQIEELQRQLDALCARTVGGCKE